ncbi:surfactin synthase thioesterase subunit [Crossiella equi]|uniref:Surfactin synthase thioesterase subunit n=1 Tax=Crossiella equi TaxID=130796 RepID=A0ABS5A4T6_9PSEU|nr:alpha/beta fold hydrolase [Crossiella equi]MBP2471585.1 surfactin synthase thioesterase subunit [Crossiella equi]
MRLYGIPAAGGAASAFQDWPELTPLRLPGRDQRAAEPIPDTVAELVADLADQVGEPGFALYGHSFGAILAYELARLRPPAHLFVAASADPQTESRHEAREESDVDFIARLPGYGVPEEVLADEELLEVLLPRFRADFALAERYRYTPGPPLDCPITVFGGEDDPLVPVETLDRWTAFSLGLVTTHVLPGGHTFPTTARERLRARIKEETA